MKRLLALLVLTAAAQLANATPIGDKYAQLGGAGGFLRTPTIPETTAPDGIGKFRHYQHGSIYWHPETGAREVPRLDPPALGAARLGAELPRVSDHRRD